MEGLNLEKIGAALGSVLIFLGAALAALRSHNKSDGKPPPQRLPTYQEIRECLGEFKRTVERHKEAHEDVADRLGERLERLIRHQERMDDRLDGLLRSVERVEAAQRFEQVVKAWRLEAEEKEDK